MALCAGHLRLSSLFRPYSPRSPRLPIKFPEAIRCAKGSQRAGKKRYPSEKKKLRRLHSETLAPAKNREEGVWRLSKLSVPVDKDPGKDHIGVSDALLEAVAKVLKFPVVTMLPQEAFTIVRKSFDARKGIKGPKFIYTVDIDIKKLLELEPRTWDFISRLEPKVGLVEYMPHVGVSDDLMSIIQDYKKIGLDVGLMESGLDAYTEKSHNSPFPTKPKVAVVGSGPSGLFASLVLAELGAEVSIIERGQAVERRGRDIGALMVRRILQPESNFCFGEVHGVMESW